MTIKEMEAKIDRLGLEKLEVRLSKGREVDVFICAIKNNECAELEEGGQHRGNIVVFDGNGRCWETEAYALWGKGNDYDVTWGINGYGQNVPIAVNKYALVRMPQRDLDPIRD